MHAARSTAFDTGPLLFSLALAGVLFIGDLFVPNGFGYGVAYTVAVLTTLSSSQRRVTVITAVAATIFTIAGTFVDTEFGGAPLGEVAANRALSIAVIWTMALIIVHHKKTARVMHLSQGHKAAILDSIQTAFIEMDDAGRITEWNSHAEMIFGWSRQEALGRALAETIIPEGAREAHKRGLQRYLSTGRAIVLNRWIELEALRRDGTTFPVELLLGVRQRASGAHHFFGFIQDISDRKRSELELKKNHSALASLAGRLISSHEDERRRLAHDIHDDFSQRLAIWAMELALAEEGAPQDVPRLLQGLRQQAEELSLDLHEMSHRLHPAILGQLGLVAGIENECERFQDLEGIGVRFIADPSVRMPSDISLALYRIVQEGLRNVAKHARAHGVTVRLARQDGRVLLSITDDGVGFEIGSREEKAHLGLLSMTERARAVQGRLTVTSEPGQGTCVEIDVPLRPTEFSGRSDKTDRF